MPARPAASLLLLSACVLAATAAFAFTQSAASHGAAAQSSLPPTAYSPPKRPSSLRPGPLRSGAACTSTVKRRRARALRSYMRVMVKRRRAYFRTHRGLRARRRFVRRQRKTLAALRRAVARCSVSAKADPNLVPENPGEQPPPPCAPTLTGVPGKEMHEGTFASSLSLGAVGSLPAVMLFVDFPDVPASETTGQLYDRLVPTSHAWVRDVSYGRASLDVTAIHRWYRMSRPVRDYGLGDGVSFVEQWDVINEAVRAADQDFDFSPFKIVYVVLARGSNQPMSPAFHSFEGGGVEADGTELRYGATFGQDIRGPDPLYASFVLLHETGHVLGLPDLYDSPNPRYWSLLRYAGGWDMMSWNSPGASFLAWHKWKLGWLDSSQLTCLTAPGDLTTTLMPLASPTGLKAVVVPVSPSVAYMLEARKRIGQDRRLCEDGVLVYTVDATVESGHGPVRVQPAQRDTNTDTVGRCGPLYNAPFDHARGEVDRFEDAQAGVSLEVLGHTASGGYRVRITRR